MKNRWFVVLGALIIQVSLGAVYIWSVFQTPLLSHYPSWKETQVTLPAQIILACFAIAVIIAGRIQDKVGPRPVAIAGGMLLGAGLILAKFTANFPPSTALIWLIISYSVLGGLGIGAAYVCPIATCVKWFPDKRGLITGLAVAGFGAGAFFFAPLAKGLIDGSHYQLFGTNLFSLPEAGLFNTFLILGVIFLVLITLGALLLKNPEPGYRPAGWNPPVQSTDSLNLKAEFTPTEMLRTRQFWLLWGTYLIGCAAGLMIIMKASPIWESFALTTPGAGTDYLSYNQIASTGAMAVSILAIFNALGRIIWGKVSDIAGRKPTLIAMFLLCTFIMLTFNNFKQFPAFLAAISVVGLCFGGFLAVFPAVTADYFGTKNYGANYGWMFSAYGVGGLLGPYLAAALMETSALVRIRQLKEGQEEIVRSLVAGDYSRAFLVAGILCLISTVALFTLKKPTAQIEK